jgi:hypothetical protein
MPSPLTLEYGGIEYCGLPVNGAELPLRQNFAYYEARKTGRLRIWAVCASRSSNDLARPATFTRKSGALPRSFAPPLPAESFGAR